MQVTMWVILGAMVALAAAVVRYRADDANVELGPPIQAGGLSFRVPGAWSPVPDEQPYVIGAWAATGELPQSLTVYRERLPFLLSPLDYLLRSGLVPANAAQTSSTQISFGAYRGAMISSSRPVRMRGADRTMVAHQILAGVILPGRWAITFRLQGIDEHGAASAENLMRRIAASLIVSIAPATPQGG